MPLSEPIPTGPEVVSRIAKDLERLLACSGRPGQAGRAVDRLLSRWPDIRNAAHAPESVLRQVGALTRLQARRAAAALRLARTLAAAPEPSVLQVLTPQDAIQLVRGLAVSRIERFWVVALGPRSQVLGLKEVARGTIDTCPISPREVFRYLLEVDAHRGLLAHNHPSGDTEPSAVDRSLTRELVMLGRILGAPIVDHLIVGRSGFVSFLASGWIEDSEGSQTTRTIQCTCSRAEYSK